MTFLSSTAMIIILLTIILILIFLVVKLNIQFYIEKKSYKIKLCALQDMIIEISKKQLGQAEQLKLSEELELKVHRGKFWYIDEILPSRPNNIF